MFGLSGAFSPNFYVYMLFRFLVAVNSIGAYTAAFILGLELVGASKRAMCGTLISYMFAVGEMILAGVAYALRNWTLILLATSAPVFLFLLYFPNDEL